ncbi:putative beta-lysine N-acetyltransferase [Bacillus coahuilensis]|nr:putative beta-lysine N-acetyltransferase [Bacillus coahuilensis]
MFRVRDINLQWINKAKKRGKLLMGYKEVLLKENATLYCDPYNKRIRVDTYSNSLSELFPTLLTKASKINADKIIVKARTDQVKDCLRLGFNNEGIINNYFNGEDAWFFSYFLTRERRESHFHIEETTILRDLDTVHAKPISSLPTQYQIRKATLSDSSSLAVLYQNTFPIYPVPIHHERYISESMKDTVYYCIEIEGDMISAASAEINRVDRNAEITDCATLKKYRSLGLLKNIMNELEEELKGMNIPVVYSLARALSLGMNKSLKQLGYEYQGKLVNNCYIYDKLESMNIWSKSL